MDQTKRWARAISRWVMIFAVYVFFGVCLFFLSDYSIQNGNFIYPRHLNSSEWKLAVLQLQGAALGLSFLATVVWNSAFSSLWLSGKGNEGFIAKRAIWVVWFALLLINGLLPWLLLASYQATDVFTFSPPYWSPAAYAFPFLLCALLLSPNCIKYIGPYKRRRPLIMGG